MAEIGAVDRIVEGLVKDGGPAKAIKLAMVPTPGTADPALTWATRLAVEDLSGSHQIEAARQVACGALQAWLWKAYSAPPVPVTIDLKELKRRTVELVGKCYPVGLRAAGNEPGDPAAEVDRIVDQLLSEQGWVPGAGPTAAMEPK